MTSNNFPEIPEANIFDHNVDLFIVSNVFYNQQNNSIIAFAYQGTNQLVILEQIGDELLKNPILSLLVRLVQYCYFNEKG